MKPDATRGLDLLAPHPGLLLAVSGGPDSVALMLLCARWPGRAAHRIDVATVDHGLRPGSRDEAEQVGNWARALGFTHHLLSWAGEKPATRIQERAREARYRLLADCARAIGASAIVTAHHADDQAETILFRLTRGSGVAGLSGMSPASALGPVALLRPLLASRKSALVGLCEAAGHPYVADPSNADDAYARVRLRKLAPVLDGLGLDTEALLRLGARAAQADAALRDCASDLRRRALLESGPDHACFAAAELRDAPLELTQRLVAGELARLAPDAYVRLDRLERAVGRLAGALRDGERLRLTLGGLVFDSTPELLTVRPAPPRRTRQPEVDQGS
ncbi:MAG: tRNA lysidine(34) synthetase TilS [Methylocystis sp.]|uniref:tRNA lysidine(34) synthetase TilS n=1 Tax=Methylocystis sp. TaxID=1911079 RepID=UPI003DA5A231